MVQTTGERRTVGASRRIGVALWGLFMAVGMLGWAGAQGGEVGSLAEKWRSGEKLRVLIARSPSFRQGMTREQVREIRDAGFNVFGHRWIRPAWRSIPRERIEAKVALCQELGLHYMSWMRGSIHQDPEDPSKRMTWEDGTVQEGLFGPLSPELWEFLTEGLTYLAGLGVDGPVAGAFLDFENYAPGKRGNLYHTSYDPYALRLFAEARGVQAPPDDLAPGGGSAWLEGQGLADAFVRWQDAEFRARSRQLREAIDDVNPEFLVGAYSGEGMLRIFYEEMATARVPLVLAPASTYGRASELLSQAESLEANQNIVLAGMAAARQRVSPFIYLAGIMPGHRGSDPEFTGKNMVASAAMGHGYWIWIEKRYGTPEWNASMAWMARANEDVRTGRLQMHREPRLEPEVRHLPPPERQTDLPQVGVRRASAALMETIRASEDFEAHAIEGFSLSYLRNFDVVVLQNFNVSLGPGSRVHAILQDYVRGGGSLFITHNTGRHLESPFPDIAVRDFPTQRVSPSNQVLDRRMAVKNTAGVLPADMAGERFTAGFGDHIIFAAGPDGTVLVENHFGDPVYVVGEYGQGRVAFSGCHFAYRYALEEGGERRALYSVLDWLARKDGAAVAAKIGDATDLFLSALVH